jgi:hemolysin activation/secretion protein
MNSVPLREERRAARDAAAIVCACGEGPAQSKGRGVRPAGRVCLAAFGAAALLAVPAWAQDSQPKQPPPPPPVDINQVQPKPKPPAPEPAPSTTPGTPPAAAPGGEAATPAPQATATAEDGAKYPVSRFILEYHSEHAGHPPIDDLLGARVRLSVTPDGLVSYREGLPSVTIRIGEIVEGSGATFYRSALNAVAKGVVEELNRRGLIGIIVQLHPEDINETTGEDLRQGQRSELRMIIWTGVVKEVRTIAGGDRLKSAVESGKLERVNPNDPVHNRIRAQSPVQEGDLLRRDAMDDFVFRLNRHPGRRVDIAIAPGEAPGDVVVDYLVNEAKPWSAYFQVSNTGTETTNEWRERFGFVHNQLTGHDDVLRLDYITGGFSSASNSVNANYEFPLASDRMHMRTYAGYSDFDASDVGFAGEEFTGTTWSAGAEVSGILYEHRELFLDAVGGIRWENVKIDNTAINETGQDNFVLPYVGLRLDRATESATTFGSLIMEFQVPELAGTNKDEIQKLGRLDVDDSWQVLKYDLEHSFFLEPLLNPRGFRGETTSGSQTLANEVAASVRGQYAFGNRLIPNEEEVAGGMFSVRGYPESITAGDNAIIASLEYRYHLPRTFQVSEPGHIGEREINWLGRDFRWAPQQAFGQADWDLIFKGFIDAGRTTISNPRPGENDHTLVGAGVGTELNVKRNVSLRLDLGFALEDVKDEPQTVKAGDARLHFSLTLLY